MAVYWSATARIAKRVWVCLINWVFSCLSVANQIASSIRSGDIGPFTVA